MVNPRSNQGQKGMAYPGMVNPPVLVVPCAATKIAPEKTTRAVEAVNFMIWWEGSRMREGRIIRRVGGFYK